MNGNSGMKIQREKYQASAHTKTVMIAEMHPNLSAHCIELRRSWTITGRCYSKMAVDVCLQANRGDPSMG